MAREQGRVMVAQNRRARHDYHIDAVFEAGLVLVGTEVKSLRAGRATIGDGFAQFRGRELFLLNVHIPEYDPGTWTNHDPRRPRKLLLHRRELSDIDKAMRGGAAGGVTLIPLSLYFKDGYAKVDVALARGKKAHDKRQAIAEREARREAERALRDRQRRG
jgi:SsrA-binding protein